MRRNNSEDDPSFIEYDDDNMEHVLAGPDYGQPNSASAWSEIDSSEYPSYVNDIKNKILSRRFKITS